MMDYISVKIKGAKLEGERITLKLLEQIDLDDCTNTQRVCLEGLMATHRRMIQLIESELLGDK